MRKKFRSEEREKNERKNGAVKQGSQREWACCNPEEQA